MFHTKFSILLIILFILFSTTTILIAQENYPQLDKKQNALLTELVQTSGSLNIKDGIKVSPSTKKSKNFFWLTGTPYKASSKRTVALRISKGSFADVNKSDILDIKKNKGGLWSIKIDDQTQFLVTELSVKRKVVQPVGSRTGNIKSEKILKKWSGPGGGTDLPNGTIILFPAPSSPPSEPEHIPVEGFGDTYQVCTNTGEWKCDGRKMLCEYECTIRSITFNNRVIARWKDWEECGSCPDSPDDDSSSDESWGWKDVCNPKPWEDCWDTTESWDMIYDW